MKYIFYIAILLPCLTTGMDQTELDRHLGLAVSTNGVAYLMARQSIVESGKNVLPILIEVARDGQRTWQQRLAARICYERILRIKEIDQLRQYNWRKDPGYDREWGKNIMGPSLYLGRIVNPHCVKAGLWYYYVELTWKQTREYSLTFSSSFHENAWRGWCSYALKEQPEYFYLINAKIDRIQSDPSLSANNLVYYRTLLRDKESDSVPALVTLYDNYNKHEVGSFEAFPGRHSELYRGMFESILSFADSRHADLIEKFISEHPALAPLKDKVAEIRNRPAPPPRVEPPFRLGQQLVNP